MQKQRTTLWMRYVSFERITGALQLLRKNGPLNAANFDSLCVTNGVFVGTHQKPFSHSTMCHYRETMRKLELVTVDKEQYSCDANPRAYELLAVCDPYPAVLNSKAKDILAKIVCSNDECRRVFFDLMSPQALWKPDLLRTEGTPLIMRSVVHSREKGQTKRTIPPTTVLTPLNREPVTLVSIDAINAIVRGVRLWAVDLGITDEVMFDSTEGRVIVPVRHDLSSRQIEYLLWKTILSCTVWEGSTEWGMCYVPNVVRAMLVKYHISAEDTQHAYHNLCASKQQCMMSIPTTSALIDIKTPYRSQDSAFAKAYFRLQRGPFISHLRVSSFRSLIV